LEFHFQPGSGRGDFVQGDRIRSAIEGVLPDDMQHRRSPPPRNEGVLGGHVVLREAFRPLGGGWRGVRVRVVDHDIDRVEVGGVVEERIRSRFPVVN
jgi:hypothetical protein